MRSTATAIPRAAAAVVDMMAAVLYAALSPSSDAVSHETSELLQCLFVDGPPQVVLLARYLPLFVFRLPSFSPGGSFRFLRVSFCVPLFALPSKPDEGLMFVACSFAALTADTYCMVYNGDR